MALSRGLRATAPVSGAMIYKKEQIIKKREQKAGNCRTQAAPLSTAFSYHPFVFFPSFAVLCGNYRIVLLSKKQIR
jgi:hypothetical protein